MQIECRFELTPAGTEKWRRFLVQAQHQHPRQDPKFAAVERALGNSPVFTIGRRDDGTICAVAWFSRQPSRLIPGRFCVATAMSGPICDDQDTMMAFLDALAKQPAFAKVDALTITPYWLGKEAEDLARCLVQAGWHVPDFGQLLGPTGLIDLTRSETEIRESFSSSARYKLRLIEKLDIAIRPLTTLAEAGIFFDCINRLLLTRIGAPLFPRAECALAIENVAGAPAGGAIFGAYHGDVLLGGLLVYRSMNTAHAFRYAADPAAAAALAKAANAALNNLRVAPSLWLEGMLWAKRQGCTRFDVEGYALIDDKAHPEFNIHQYKRQLGPVPVQRLSNHTRPLNRAFHAANQLPRQLKQLIKTHMPGLAARLRRVRG